MENGKHFKKNQETIYTYLNQFVQGVASAGIVSSGFVSMIYKNPNYLTGAAIGASVLLAYAAKKFIDEDNEGFKEKILDKLKNKEDIKYSLEDESNISKAINELNEIENDLQNNKEEFILDFKIR